MDVYDKIQKGDYETKIPWSRSNRDAYHAELADLMAKFKHDLESEFGLTNHPKRDRLYSIAYEEGHSSGCSEIWNYYSTLQELLQEDK